MTPFEQGTQMMLAKRLELESCGHTRALAKAAVDRALGAARARVRDVSPEIQGRAFLDTLRAELQKAETWIRQELSQAGS